MLERAKDRIEEAILFRTVSKKSPSDDVETSSFPVAIMITAATADSFIKKRYALAEAKRVSSLLRDEEDAKIMEITTNFKWRIRAVTNDKYIGPYSFALHFTDFLKNAADFQDKKWKLVNRLVLQKEVYLTKMEVSRLLEEEVRRYIENKLSTNVGVLPQGIIEYLTQLKQLASEKRGKIQLNKYPKEKVVAAFPPCVKKIYNTMASGHPVSHIGRFALTTFLANVGMSVEEIINLFRSISDFDEKMTRYQVEHIAGVRGSQTKYITPRCDTLRTHGVCPGRDELCKEVRHPLAYYRRKT